MSDFQCIKLNIHYRGDVNLKNDSFDYIGGFEKKDMLIDPDLMTWSTFDDFCKENGVCGTVEQVWYKLPHEDISSTRVIGSDKDSGIRELCREALIGGEADVYIQQGVSEPEPFPLSNPEEYYVAEENEESDEDVGEDKTAEEQRIQDEGEDPVEEGLPDDPRFGAFFEEIHNETGQTEEATGQTAEAAGQPGEAEAPGQAEEDEDEFERQCMDAERPEPAMDTDDEWDAYDQRERETSRMKYSKDKPPYLWKMQTFNSGEDFKDQLLRIMMIHGAFIMHQKGGGLLKVNPHHLLLQVNLHRIMKFHNIQVFHQAFQVVEDVHVVVLLDVVMVVARLLERVVAEDLLKLLKTQCFSCLLGLTKSLMFGNLKLTRN